jgi:hypothetical protein
MGRQLTPGEQCERRQRGRRSGAANNDRGLIGTWSKRIAKCRRRCQLRIPSIFVGLSSPLRGPTLGHYHEVVRRLNLCVTLLLCLSSWSACSTTNPLSAPSSVAAPETAIHIFSLSPRAGSTLDYGSPFQVTGHYTFSTADSARRATTAAWVCLGLDRDTFITASCSGGHPSATDQFSETATIAVNTAAPRSERFDTQFAYLLLVDGPLTDADTPISSSRISQIKGTVLTGLTFPHVIRWQ